MAKLVYVIDGVTHEFALEPGRAAYTLGRNPMCDLRVNTPSMSRRHAEIRVDAANSAYTVHDLGSSNGTYVNGQRANGVPLKHGDEIMCGDFKFAFRDAAPAKRTKGMSPNLPSQPARPPSTTEASRPTAAARVPSRSSASPSTNPSPSRRPSAPNRRPSAPSGRTASPSGNRPSPPPIQQTHESIPLPEDLGRASRDPRRSTGQSRAARASGSHTQPTAAGSAARLGAEADPQMRLALEKAIQERDHAQKRVRALVEEVTAMRRELQDAPQLSEMELLQAELREVREQKVQLESKVADLSDQFGATDTALREKLSEQESLIQERDAALARVAELEQAQQGEAGEEVASLRAELETMQTQLESALTAAAQNENESPEHALRSELELVKETFEEQSSDWTETRRNMEAAFDDLRGELERLITVNQRMQHQIRELGERSGLPIEEEQAVAGE